MTHSDQPRSSENDDWRSWLPGPRRLELDLWPPAIALILAATSIPIDFRAAQAIWSVDFDLRDFLQNLLLFGPLGLALAHRSARVVLVVPLILSLGVEAVQVWEFERFSSMFDVIANTAGAVGVAWLCRVRHGHERLRLTVNLWGVVLCVLMIGAILTTWRLPARSSALEAWDPTFALMLGNEATHDRPWRGVIGELALYDRSLSREEIRKLRSVDEHHQIARPIHRSGPHRLDGAAPTTLPAGLSSHLVERIRQSNAFSVAALIRADDLAQEGPARIVTFSRSTQERNFDLGQDFDRIVFRVRTPVSGPNGQDVRAETESVLRQRDMLVVATYDGAIARIYVDGEARARKNIAAMGCTVSALCDSGLPLAWTALGAGLALVLIAFTRVSRRRLVIALCVGAGVAWVGIDRAVGLMPDGVAARPWLSYSALLGALAIGIAYVLAMPTNRAINVA